MKTSTSQERHGVQWTACMQLKVLNFTDDLAHTHRQIQVKKVSVASTSASNRCKRSHFLRIIDEKQGGSDPDVKEKIGKKRTVFLQLKNVLNSKQLSSNIKVRIFSTNSKTVSLHRAEP
ncbi:unnamed protein product [Schistosoma margrebowiei]|uniref:Uncharacterized protein n=1 Tax=Schistosoma margrebowiei TaxID=48269 RepID=A0A183N1E5_9TREM|nr:unnamed protein product [Schistosoma margrebowiei]